MPSMKVLFWIVVLPLLLIAAFFAIANGAPVTLNLWPIDSQVSMPLFVALLGFLYLGFVFGALVAWWGGRHARARARNAARRVEALQREVAELTARLDARPPSPAPAATPPVERVPAIAPPA